MSSLCILEVKPLSKISFENIFSHTVGYFFTIFLVAIANGIFVCVISVSGIFCWYTKMPSISEYLLCIPLLCQTH